MLKPCGGTARPLNTTNSFSCMPTVTACQRTITEAMKWFRKAAEQDYSYVRSTARFNRDLLHAYGEGVPEDDVQFNFVAAVRWFRTVAGHGRYDSIGQALLNLGVIYDIGLGVPEDNAEAARWFSQGR